MEKNLKDLYDMIKDIKNSISPAIYLGVVSIKKMKLFLDGFVSFQETILEQEVNYLIDFEIFINQYFDVDSRQSWAELILQHSGSEAEAFQIFYKLFDEFLVLKYKKEDIYYDISVFQRRQYFKIKDIHYTNHGNLGKIPIPHEHDIKYFSLKNGSYYYLKLFDETEVKDNSFFYQNTFDVRKVFENIDEFIALICRGGELEFIYKNKEYSISYPLEVLTLTKIDTKEYVEFESYKELLKYRIEGTKMEGIITEIVPYYRSF